MELIQIYKFLRLDRVTSGVAERIGQIIGKAFYKTWEFSFMTRKSIKKLKTPSDFRPPSVLEKSISPKTFV